VQANTIRTIGFLFLSGLVLFELGCKSTSVAVVESPVSIHEVNLEDLIQNIGNYHGKTIQTRGWFSVGFEESALYLGKVVVLQDSSFKFERDSFSGVWIEPDMHFVPVDSIESFTHKKSGRLTTIQGIIDTTRTGHMGLYAGTIMKARFVLSR
jgi:hypothetical protein